MPVYTYRCEKCGVQFERNQKFTEQPLTRCPECGKKTLRKVYTPVGIVFKGSGFYATDHRSASGNRYSSPKSEDKTEKTSESKLSESKAVSETAPASAASETKKE